ncbi:hypothetical protein H9P43_008412 [Blastocladiella emersonii ATCC 22665]|nr:hypothetical protein H9P43_008412 [Blastocladiella emersonii ATCC 22665]
MQPPRPHPRLASLRALFASAALALLLLLAIAPSPSSQADIGYCGTMDTGCQLALNKALDVNRTAYVKDDDITVMLRVFYTNTTANGTQTVAVTSNMSSIFFPRVDQYTKLTIPKSYDLLTRLPSISVSLALVHAGRVYALPAKAWWSTQFNRYIPFRTVIVTMVGGVITQLEWEQTKCYYTNCDCLDNMCPIDCGTDQSACNIQVHLAWAGTDAKGTYLQSSMSSLWKLQNVI